MRLFSVAAASVELPPGVDMEWTAELSSLKTGPWREAHGHSQETVEGTMGMPDKGRGGKGLRIKSLAGCGGSRL